MEADADARPSSSILRWWPAGGWRTSSAGCTSWSSAARQTRSSPTGERRWCERPRGGGQGGPVDLPRRGGPVSHGSSGRRRVVACRHPRPRCHRGVAGGAGPDDPPAPLPHRPAQDVRGRSGVGYGHHHPRCLRRDRRHLGHELGLPLPGPGGGGGVDRRDRADPAHGLGCQGQRAAAAQFGPPGDRGGAGPPCGHRVPAGRGRDGEQRCVPHRSGVLSDTYVRTLAADCSGPAG